ncbi:hypothetical protein SAMN05421771_1579 [Granulicella pectinivorans]|uniref:Uncharacterized protein n=2 Tax=Granulicella pectinivorans TaxID=474950 RepID=A0A1I6LZZ9_9BACT|nr:hypothetical protein SAMN05421771_1579 [Granulicella pectinivorans]
MIAITEAHTVALPAVPGLGPVRMRRFAAAFFAAAVFSLSAPAQKADTPQAPLTREQAKALLASVDEILDFVSKDTKLPITHPVKRKLVSRAEVTKYLQKKFDEDEATKRMEHGEIVLKKFGLLERDFQLRPFLIRLLTEQIAGFYDEKTKTVNLLDYVAPDEQKPVLAHELTHALQDMKVDLVTWSDLTPDAPPKTMLEDNQRLAVDESGAARESVTEGQAMVTFIDYSLKPTGKTLADAPEMGERLKDTVADNADSPVMARAPLLLQQTLMFPYSAGLAFEAAVLAKGGREAAFAGTLANPPSSTFEVIHPQAYLSHAAVPMLRLPDLRPMLAPDYSFYDIGVMGELDVRILTELFGGRQIADALSTQWYGGMYYAAQRNDAADKQSPASIALLYVSRWQNEDSARSFLRVYAGQLARKYSGLKRREKDEADDSEQVYTTTEGDVLLTIQGNTVFTFEGFPLAKARAMRDAIGEVQSSGPIMQAQEPVHDLTHSLTHLGASFGMLRSEERYTSQGLQR